MKEGAVADQEVQKLSSTEEVLSETQTESHSQTEEKVNNKKSEKKKSKPKSQKIYQVYIGTNVLSGKMYTPGKYNLSKKDYDSIKSKSSRVTLIRVI